AEHGLTYDDLAKADYLSFSEATDNMRNKQIDAAFITSAIPTSSVSELSQTVPIVIISVEEDKINSLAQKYPFYTAVTVPAGSYKGQEEDALSPAVMAMLIVPKDMDDDLVYNIVKNLYDRQQIIVDTHKRGEDITLETALDGMSINLHPGAQKYFDEMGIESN
ncbi:MAG TPA: TAXI family TRAP transporter solute-binding subunit, partial [Clostridia bacterium]|nr:TAXI family TRAP transporter solute-binding subunit [Clostridia bacterium]